MMVLFRALRHRYEILSSSQESNRWPAIMDQPLRRDFLAPTELHASQLQKLNRSRVMKTLSLGSCV